MDTKDTTIIALAGAAIAQSNLPGWIKLAYGLTACAYVGHYIYRDIKAHK